MIIGITTQVIGETEINHKVLREGGLVTVFAGPTTTNVTKIVYMTTTTNATATATVPGGNKWGYGSDPENLGKDILVDLCDSDESNDDMTIAYHGSPSGSTDYSFVTFIDDGIITYCDDDEDGDGDGDGDDNEDGVHEFTLLITDEDQVHGKPDPALAAVDDWVKLEAFQWNVDGSFDPRPVVWTITSSNAEDIEFSDADDGDVLTSTELETERSSIWIRSDKADHYVVKYSFDPGSESDYSDSPTEGTLDFYALEIASVEWLDIEGNAITEQNDHPVEGANVGLKHYPGAKMPDGDWEDVVKVRVTVNPAVEGATVYLKDYDPDDPSADNDVVDDDTDGGDNRGAGYLHSLSTDTDSNGQVTVKYDVSHQPGDNHRVAAVVENKNELDELDDNNVTADNEQVSDFGGLISDLLTVWRKLHIEHDSMASEPTGSDKSPDINSFIGKEVLDNTPAPGFSTIKTAYPLHVSENFYEGGFVYVHGLAEFGPYRVYSNTSRLLPGADDIVVEGIISDEDSDIIVDSLIMIKDDDAGNQLPYYDDLNGFVKNVYKHAYLSIDVVDDSINPDKEVGFNLNLTNVEMGTDDVFGVGVYGSRNLSSSDKFWVSLLVSCYQGKSSFDQDADFKKGVNNSGGVYAHNDYDQSYLGGATRQTASNGSFIFIETIRDMALHYNSSLKHTIAHEIGHSGGPPEFFDNNAHHEDGDDTYPPGIMGEGAPKNATSFNPVTLKRFREAIKW